MTGDVFKIALPIVSSVACVMTFIYAFWKSKRTPRVSEQMAQSEQDIVTDEYFSDLAVQMDVTEEVQPRPEVAQPGELLRLAQQGLCEIFSRSVGGA